MQDMSAFFSIRADGTATDIDYYGNHKLWELYRTDRDAYENVWRVWRSLRRKNFHALPEDKGIPVPHTGKSRWHSGKNSGKTGVIGSSRMLPHRYMDEGDKGKGHNRHIKRLERRMWQRDWMDEGYDYEDASSASEWFAHLDALDTLAEYDARERSWWERETDPDYCGDPFCDIC